MSMLMIYNYCTPLVDSDSLQNRENFMGSAFIISQFSHKNVLSLLGISTTSSPLMAIYTYANLGDLKHFLTRYCI